jgi:hypothetical protein
LFAAASQEKTVQFILAYCLDSLATIVNLISHTTTKSGLYVEASLDYASYEKGIEVPDVEMDKLHLKRDKFHGEWNYSLIPR